jgi:hypothetical protein
VDCALTVDAVTKHFGAQWKPVVVGGECYFMEAKKSGWIMIHIGSGPLMKSSDTRIETDLDITIAGRPGVAYANKATAWVQVSLGRGADVNGWVHVETHRNLNQPALEAAAADIVGKYFN